MALVVHARTKIEVPAEPTLACIWHHCCQVLKVEVDAGLLYDGLARGIMSHPHEPGGTKCV